ncbi:MAG: hypothetical protein KDA25_13345 [Phycisphaerales bacterium]|nr:hypothetical protein [Phycisphaerales bacterium]
MRNRVVRTRIPSRLAAGLCATCAGLCAILSTGFAGASPLEAAHVPADTAWVLHIDFERFYASQVGRAIVDHGPDADERREMVEQFGFDYLTDLKAITTYGQVAEDGARRETTIVYATAAADEALRHAESEFEGFHAVTHDGASMFTWSESEDDGLEMKPRYGALYDPGVPDRRIIAVGPTPEDVAGALALLAGRGRSLKDDAARLADVPARDGVFVQGVAFSLDHARTMHLASEILKEARQVAGQIGESDGRLFSELIFTARAADRVQQITQVAQGLLALARLSMSADDDSPNPLLGFLANITVLAEGPVVRVRFEAPSEAVAGVMGTSVGRDANGHFAVGAWLHDGDPRRRDDAPKDEPATESTPAAPRKGSTPDHP